MTAFVKSWQIPVHLDGSFDPNATYKGQPLLILAMHDPQLLNSLLEEGANPNVCDVSGEPAIISALKIASGKPDEIISMLLKYGANPNAMDAEGKTAVFHTQSYTTLKLLCDAKADINAVDKTGNATILFKFRLDNLYSHRMWRRCECKRRKWQNATILFKFRSNISYTPEIWCVCECKR
ncbi:MAG: hypothetical protein IJU23_04975 [Proteobacteria bacterium]|nr:hypothetical protein [Pseudomonadota bacterium]